MSEKHQRRSRRSFAPDPEPISDESPQENCFEQMDIDKEEKDFQKRVRAKYRGYHAGLKQLKKDQEKEWKALLINKEGSDYSNYLQPEDKEFLEKVHSTIAPYSENITIIKEQKEKLISIEALHQILHHRNKLLEDLRQQESIKIKKLEFQLPL